MLTWRAHDARRMESVRVQLSGKRIKANGRIVAAATDTNPAFAAYYDLLTDETGATKRLGMTVTLAERERQLVVARDEREHVAGHRPPGRVPRGLRRCAGRRRGVQPVLQRAADSPARPAMSGPTRSRCRRSTSALPEMSITSAPVSYSSPAAGAGEGIKVHSPVSETVLTVDARRVHRRLPRLGRADLITPPARPAAASSRRQFSAPTNTVTISGREKLS